MASSSISISSCSYSTGSGKYEFGYTPALTSYYIYIYSTYKFTLSSATNLLSVALNYKILGNSKTIYWKIDQSSSNSDSFTADGSFSSGSGGTNSYTSHSKTLEKSGTFAAGTYYLHLRTNGGNAGYGYLSSGTVTYNAVATYTVTLNANGGTVPALTSVSAGNSGGTLAKGVSVPVIEGSTIALTQNQEYLLEFSYKADSSTNFHVDLFPDTLPQTMPSATTALQRYSWNFSSSSADIKSCKLRFFNDLTIPNPTNIYISTVKLYKVGSGTSSTSKTVENGSKYGQLPNPTRSGYQFNGWYTATSGGTRIYDTTSVSLSGNQTLYAQWIAYTYTVTFNDNGGTGGPGTQTKTHGTALTLSSTKPTRADSTLETYTVTFDGNGGTASKASQTVPKKRTYTFKNWNTKADGSGTSYSAGGSYTSNSAITLYAQWNYSDSTEAVTAATATRGNGTSTRKVTFDATTNGGTCSTASLNSTASITYSMNGWFAAKSGGSVVVAAGGSYTPTASTTLYAQWGSSTGSYSAITLPTASKAESTSSVAITINANGGSSTVSSCSSTKTTSYPFSGWYDAASGGNVKGKSGASIVPSATDTYYAQFGSATSYSTVTLPTAEQCTRTGYTLLGFATSSTATSSTYSPGAKYNPTGATTLYAVWKQSQAVYIKDSTGSFNAYQVYIANASGEFELYIPYVYKSGAWVECTI